MSYNRHRMTISNTEIAMRLSSPQGILKAFNSNPMKESSPPFGNSITNWQDLCFLHSESNRKNTPLVHLPRKKNRVRVYSNVRMDLYLIEVMDLYLKEVMGLNLSKEWV